MLTEAEKRKRKLAESSVPDMGYIGTASLGASDCGTHSCGCDSCGCDGSGGC